MYSKGECLIISRNNCALFFYHHHSYGTRLVDDTIFVSIAFAHHNRNVVDTKAAFRHVIHLVSVLLIAATNRNLEDEVNNRKFRRDLFFRLNVVPIKMPSLRERKSDIPLLAQHFIHKYSERCHRKITGISTEAKKILIAAEWQGNIRELENVIERAIVMGATDKIKLEDLPKEMIEKNSSGFILNGDFYAQLKQAKQKIVLSAISSSNGNFTEAARLLGEFIRTTYTVSCATWESKKN